MKRNIIKKIFIGLLMLFISPLGVYADSISISCPDMVLVGKEVNCKLYGHTDGVVNAVEINLVAGDKLQIVSFEKGSNWEMGELYNGKIVLLTIEKLKETFDIGVLKVKSSGIGNNSITITSAVFVDENDIEESIDTISKTLNVKTSVTSGDTDGDKDEQNKEEDNSGVDDNLLLSSNNYLSDLVITGYDIDFDKEVYEYTVTIEDESKLEIIPQVEEGAKYTILGNNNLDDGSVIEIKVFSEDNSSKIYKINIVNENNNKIFKAILIGIIVLLVLVNVFRIIKSISNKLKEDV